MAVSSEILSAEEARAWRDDGVDGTREEVTRMADTIIALYAIIAGRDAAPTDAELAVHHAAGGSWLVSGDGWARLRAGELADESAAWCRPERTDLHHGTTRVWRWIALDAQRRPGAWPVAT